MNWSFQPAPVGALIALQVPWPVIPFVAVQLYVPVMESFVEVEKWPMYVVVIVPAGAGVVYDVPSVIVNVVAGLFKTTCPDPPIKSTLLSAVTLPVALKVSCAYPDPSMSNAHRPEKSASAAVTIASPPLSALNVPCPVVEFVAVQLYVPLMCALLLSVK